MKPQTNMASTKDWLEAEKGLRIRAYIEAYTPTLSIREIPLHRENLYDALREISVPFPIERAPIEKSQFDMEFRAWDILSDEALRIFERKL
jgi:hypothetical protein